MTERGFEHVTDLQVRGFSAAKLNVFLEILCRREDGFHELESVFQEIDLADEMTVTLTPEQSSDQLQLTGRQIPGRIEQNLALLSVQQFRNSVPSLPPVHVSIDKKIPPGSGLGGGSSNAAFVLSALQALTNAPLSANQLLSKARNLGSDVAFFLDGGTALCRGRGDVIKPIHDTPKRFFLLARPSFSLSTAEVYDHVRLTGPRREVMPFLERFGRGHWEGELVFNRLEAAAFEVRSDLRELRDFLHDCTASPWFLTGSGSVLFCPVHSASHASDLALTVSEKLPSDDAGLEMFSVSSLQPLGCRRSYPDEE